MTTMPPQPTTTRHDSSGAASSLPSATATAASNLTFGPSSNATPQDSSCCCLPAPDGQLPCGQRLPTPCTRPLARRSFASGWSYLPPWHQLVYGCRSVLATMLFYSQHLLNELLCYFQFSLSTLLSACLLSICASAFPHLPLSWFGRSGPFTQ